MNDSHEFNAQPKDETERSVSSGPLAGIRVVEFAGVGPGTYCAMLFSDLGADVVRVDRAGGVGVRPTDVWVRGRQAVSLNLKNDSDRDACLRLLDRADVLIEGGRPGVMERLGLGPDIVLGRNPGLVYGRLTGWGQTGPLSRTAGHDINYIAIAGALSAIGPVDGDPVPPLNLVGDFGGGALFLAFGILAAILEAQTSGRGQVVDAAMVDGVSSLMTCLLGLQAGGDMEIRRGENFLDGSAHYYRCYKCSDDRWIAVGAVEPQFYDLLMGMIGLPASIRPDQRRESWNSGGNSLAAVFATKPRDEWCVLLEGSDACVAPVLDLDEAPHHEQLKARGTYCQVAGVLQPAPAPRFSRTPGRIQGPPPDGYESMESVLSRWAAPAVKARSRNK